MKLQIDKFLTLTAMMASAQIGAFACTTDDSSDDSDSLGSDDAGADDDEGSSDDDVAADDDGDDDVAAEGDDDLGDDDVAAEGGDAGADDDVAAEGGDAGADDDVAAEGGDAGADLDAGAEGEVWTDAGGEGDVYADAGSEALPPAGDAGAEGAGECLDGTDPAMEAFDCYYMFSDCPDTYGATQCNEVAGSRTASVYGAFLDCVNAADLADPCAEAGDVAVVDCAAAADAMACMESDDRCTAAAEKCSEVDPGGCDETVAPLHSFKRDEIFGCFDYYYDLYAETYGPDYEGCGYDYEICLLGGPSGE